MKKSRLLLLLVCLAVCFTCVFTACEYQPIEPSHVHNFGTPTYQWAKDGENWTCTATRVCESDSTHIETEQATISCEIDPTATCDGIGAAIYTATFESEFFGQQSKTEILGNVMHAWGAWTNVPGTQTHQRICENEDSHVQTGLCSYVNGVCTVCGGEHINHTYNFNHVCLVCGKTHATTEHAYTNGVCAICGFEHSVHTYGSDHVCTVCGVAHETATHTWKHGACTICGVEHQDHEFGTDHICTICGKAHESAKHTFNEDFVCSICGKLHDCATDGHIYGEDHKCKLCDAVHKKLNHIYNTDHICTICGTAHETLEHTYGEDHKCSICGFAYDCKVLGHIVKTATTYTEINGVWYAVGTCDMCAEAEAKAAIETVTISEAATYAKNDILDCVSGVVVGFGGANGLASSKISYIFVSDGTKVMDISTFTYGNCVIDAFTAKIGDHEVKVGDTLLMNHISRGGNNYLTCVEGTEFFVGETFDVHQDGWFAPKANYTFTMGKENWGTYVIGGIQKITATEEQPLYIAGYNYQSNTITAKNYLTVFGSKNPYFSEAMLNGTSITNLRYKFGDKGYQCYVGSGVAFMELNGNGQWLVDSFGDTFSYDAEGKLTGLLDSKVTPLGTYAFKGTCYMISMYRGESTGTYLTNYILGIGNTLEPIYNYGELISASNADCEHDGMVAHYYDAAHNMYFDTEKQPTTLEAITTEKAKGHTYGEDHICSDCTKPAETLTHTYGEDGKCTICGKLNYGTAEAPLTVSQAKALVTALGLTNGQFAPEKAYIKGTISEVKGTPYNVSGTTYKDANITLKGSDDETIPVSYVLYANNVSLAVGDEIVLLGYLEYYNGSSVYPLNKTWADGNTCGWPELIKQSGTRTVSVIAEHATVADAATDEALATSATLGATLSFKVTAESGYVLDAVKVNGAEVTANNGVYTAIVSSETTISVEAHEQGAVVLPKETIAYTGTSTGNMDGKNQAAALGCQETAISVVGAKTNGGGNNVGLNKDGTMRLYAKHGCEMTISITGGKIKSIAIEFGATYGACEVAVDGTPVAVASGTAGAKSTAVYNMDATSVVIYNTHDKNQVHIKSITIEYELSQGHVHTYDKEVVDAKYEKSPATCEAYAVYYRSCECGEFEANDSNTFSGTVYGDHAYGELIAEVKATCTEAGTKAHYECSVCKQIFLAKDGVAVEAKELVISQPHAGTTTVEIPRDQDGKARTLFQCDCCKNYFDQATGEGFTGYEIKNLRYTTSTVALRAGDKIIFGTTDGARLAYAQWASSSSSASSGTGNAKSAGADEVVPNTNSYKFTLEASTAEGCEGLFFLKNNGGGYLKSATSNGTVPGYGATSKPGVDGSFAITLTDTNIGHICAVNSTNSAKYITPVENKGTMYIGKQDQELNPLAIYVVTYVLTPIA